MNEEFNLWWQFLAIFNGKFKVYTLNKANIINSQLSRSKNASLKRLKPKKKKVKSVKYT